MVLDSTKMRATAKNNSATGDSSDYNNPTLSAADITAFLAAITGAITTAVTATTMSTRTESNQSISTAISPFDT